MKTFATSWRSLSLCLILTLAVALPACGQKAVPTAEKITLEHSGLSNLYKIDDGVYRSEQPEAADFRALQKLGIKEVLNLRRFHSDDDEATGTTLRLHRLKTRAGALSEDDLVAALRLIKNRQGPILIHCHHGSDRTGAVCAMYRVVFQGMSKDDAIREMTQGGFGFHGIYRNIIRLIEKIDVESVKDKLGLKAAA
ncbi:MAG: dual specificity protein phosphatase family protein [Mediterranea sp.]|jgi:protein tyrosine/serine phosphatase|nr:dual specificity protein phosphatase family protein [Mediterranea sp.]